MTTAPTIDGLRAYLDASPSPYHAVATARTALDAAGFIRLQETDAWAVHPAAYVVRGGALVAWRLAPDVPAHTGFHLVGAHTDSPGLRIKPHPDTGAFGWRQLGVEIYGGPLLNSWLDRDLGLAGRVVTRDGAEHLVDLAEPIARVAQLAIHLDREVNERGLVLDKQLHLAPIWGTGTGPSFVETLADRIGAAHHAIASWELQCYDLTPAALLGADRSLLASGRLDNLVSCWAALESITHAAPTGRHAMIALFDHEEVGSASTSGAAGPLLETVLDRVVTGLGGDSEDRHRAFAASRCISADNAHAIHPNYPDRHEPGHRPVVNQGPALKVNSNQRYATSATTAAVFQQACAAARVPHQVFVSRTNLPCGSTIGPLTATRLGIETVDVGVPQLSMHSARELCGVEDPVYLARALRAFLEV